MAVQGGPNRRAQQPAGGALPAIPGTTPGSPGFAPPVQAPAQPAGGRVKGQYNRGQTGQTRKNIAAGALWGQGNMQDQGYSGGKEDGATAAKRFEQKGKWGHFDKPTWQKMVDPKTGLVMIKARGHQADRLKEGLGEWQVAPDYVQKSYQRQQSWNQANPGGTYLDRLQQIGFNKHKASGAIQYDPATGYYVNQGGEVWDNQGRQLENSPYLSGGVVNPWNAAYAGPKAGGTGGRFAGAQWNNRGGWEQAQGQPAQQGGTGGGMYSMGTEYNQYNQPWQTSPYGGQSVAMGNPWGSTRSGVSNGQRGAWGTNTWSNPTGSISNMKGFR